jgi:hypothetical protein
MGFAWSDAKDGWAAGEVVDAAAKAAEVISRFAMGMRRPMLCL